MITTTYLTTYVRDVIAWIKEAFTLAFDGNFESLTIGQFIFLILLLFAVLGAIFDWTPIKKATR